MKAIFLLSLALAAVSQAAALREAQFTRVINDVKKRPEQSTAQPAAVGDKIAGKTAVTTGAASRAELKFADGTLTRLGANSIFSLDQGSRTVDLQQGTILLQVPKQMGGARVRTAAVTAAVTGTTILIEYRPDGFIKVIVLEGQLDLFRNDKPSEFRTITAGDMVIMKPDSSTIPEPVQVDLERLKKSSLLANEKEFDQLGNQDELLGAQNAQGQKKQAGQLLQTALVIPGQGTQVTLTNDARQQLTRLIAARGVIPGTTPAQRAAAAQVSPEDVTPIRQPVIPGGAIIDDNTTIRTNPHLTTRFNGIPGTRPGATYKPGADGTFGRYLFGRATTNVNVAGTGSTVDTFVASKGNWASFMLADDLEILGAPTVVSTPGDKNLLLGSQSNILLRNEDASGAYRGSGNWDLSSTGTLDTLALASLENIYWEPTFSLYGATQDVMLYTQYVSTGGSAKQGDISITSDPTATSVDLPDGVFNIAAAGTVELGTNTTGTSTASTAASIQARSVNIHSGKDISVSNGHTIAAKENISLTATLNLTISSSSVLKRVASTDLLNILLESLNGNVTVDGSAGNVNISGRSVEMRSQAGNISITGATVTSDYFKATTLAPNGQLLIGNTTLSGNLGIALYAEGSNGSVRFVGNTTLNGPARIAGNSVIIDPGVGVALSQPANLRVHSNNHLYNDGTHGNFTDSAGTAITFGSPDARRQDFVSRHNP
jgi:hypothetical protein